MSEATSKLASIATTAGRLAAFVFLILGIPIIIFLPSAGISLPSAPPVINQIAATVFYGAFTVFGGVCGLLITYALGVIVYRRVTGVPPVEGAKSTSPITFMWWCWGAFLSWVMFIGFGKELLEVWTTTGAG